MSWLYPQWLKHLLTEADNETPCAPKVAGLIGVGSFFVLAFWSVVINHSPFNAMEYGGGLSAVIGSIGLSVGLGKAGERPA